MSNSRRIVAGAALIVLQGLALGFAANALNPHRLPWKRIPLSETHRIASSSEVLRPAREAAETTPSTPPPAEKGKNEPVSALIVQPSSAPADPPAPEPAKAPAAPKPATKEHPAVKDQPPDKPAPEPKKVEALFTTLPDAKRLFDRKSATFIDARHREDYDLEHISGALWLFSEELERLYDGVMGGIPKDRTIITYCSDPQCETAIKLADEFVARGYTHVFILLEGLPGWKDAGYPTETGGGQ